jgi:hypothetical protein
VVQFKIRLPPLIREQWYELARKLNSIQLGEVKDVAIWKWTQNRVFTMRSV